MPVPPCCSLPLASGPARAVCATAVRHEGCRRAPCAVPPSCRARIPPFPHRCRRGAPSPGAPSFRAAAARMLRRSHHPGSGGLVRRELSVPNSSTHHGTPETGVQGTDPPPERGLVGRLAHSPGPLGSGDRDTPRRCSPVLRGCRRRIRPGHARRLRRRRSALMAPRPPERSRRDGDSALDALRGTSSDPARFERRSTLDTRVNPRRDPVPRVGNGLPQECGQPLLSRADMPRHILADTTTGTGR